MTQQQKRHPGRLRTGPWAAHTPRRGATGPAAPRPLEVPRRRLDRPAGRLPPRLDVRPDPHESQHHRDSEGEDGNCKWELWDVPAPLLSAGPVRNRPAGLLEARSPDAFGMRRRRRPHHGCPSTLQRPVVARAEEVAAGRPSARQQHCPGAAGRRRCISAAVGCMLMCSVAATTDPAPITGTPSAASQPGPQTAVQASANARANDSALP